MESFGQVFDWAWGVFILLFGWMSKRLTDVSRDMVEIRRELNEHKVATSQAYMPRAEVREDIRDAIKPVADGVNEIKQMLKNGGRL